MLAAVDKGLALVSWIAAAAVVLLLFIGPHVVANDEAKPTQGSSGAAPYAGGGSSPDGKAIFTQRCGSCHTLSAAGTSGQVGPKLDGIPLSATQIQAVVRSGPGAMPSFEGTLSDAEIKAVASFVAGSP